MESGLVGVVGWNRGHGVILATRQACMLHDQEKLVHGIVAGAVQGHGLHLLVKSIGAVKTLHATTAAAVAALNPFVVVAAIVAMAIVKLVIVHQH